MPATEFSESLLDPVYISEKYGNDEIGDGSESNSFKTILRAMRYVGRESFPSIYQDSHEDGEKFEIISKWQFKEAQKIWARKGYKNVDKQRKLLEDEGKRLKNLEEAETIATQEDSSTLSPAIYVKVRDSINRRDRRVKLFGRALMFVTLRDGTGFLQCVVLTNILCQTYNALTLSTEAPIEVFGTLKIVPGGKNVR